MKTDLFASLKRKEKGIVGGGLLSHKVAPALPSTLVGLTAGFGMEPGVPPPLLPPTIPFSYSPGNLLGGHKATPLQYHHLTGTLKTK